MPAVVIIAIGVFFLLNNLGMHFHFLLPDKWWAWLILLAAVAPLTRAWQAWQARGRFDREIAYDLLTASAIVLVAVLFLADLDWGIWWPLFVILGGLYVLADRPRRQRRAVADDHGDDGTAARQ